MTAANQPEPSLREQISAQLSHAYYNGLDKKGWSQFEEKDAVDKIIALFQADEETAVREAQIAQCKRLRQLRGATGEDYYNILIGEEIRLKQLTRPQAGEGDGK